MPYKSIVITPQNLTSQPTVQTSQFYIGFSSLNDDSLTTKIYDYDLIQQDILNMFNTPMGSRVMNPTFGTKCWALLFEPFTDNVKQQISDDVTRILNYDPRVTPTQINIVETDQGMIIDAVLYFNRTNQSVSMKMNFNREIGSVTSSS